jgi:uncharacterized protein with ParB-like and HNH nuclease domain
MHIEPLFRSIEDVLNLGFFFVPRFQRPYSWEEQQIEEFWQDCIVDQADSEHFIGSLVLYKEAGKYGIVDGQQRLTTITMILCALRDAFNSRDQTDPAEGLHKLIVRANIDNKLQAVLASESTIPYFQSAIQKLPGTQSEKAISSEEKRLESAFAFIRSKIDGIIAAALQNPTLNDTKKRAQITKQLKLVRDRVLALKAVALTLDNDIDAYMIFETLNTRGKDLELGDLVRTHLAKCLPQGNATTDQVRTRFDALRKAFDQNSRKLDDFILHFWLSRFDYTAKRKIYRQLRKTVKKTNAKQFLDEFLEDGRLYLDATVPTRRKWKPEELGLAASLEALRLFRVEQPNPFVLAVVRAYDKSQISLKTLRRAISAIENFHFAFTAVTSSRSSGGISQMYARHGSEIASLSAAQEIAKKVDELTTKLKAKFPSRDEFIAGFRDLAASEKLTREKSLVRYVLHKMAEHQSGQAYDRARMSIEHLASQSGKGHTLNEETVAEIGNLAWVTDSAQAHLGTKNIHAKIKILQKEGYWLDQSLATHTGDWDKKAIRLRTDHLAGLAYDQVWRIA